MQLIFRIWRQKHRQEIGVFKDYHVDGLNENMSFLEALDHLNATLIMRDESTIAYDYDCREGICGQCGMCINGRAHGPQDQITTCQLRLRRFKDGDTVVVEPWRAKGFPIIKDLVVDRSAFDRILEKGAYISPQPGKALEANAILLDHTMIDSVMDSATCIGCGACVASCKHSSAALFTAAKLNHLNALPQGEAEANQRTLDMTAQMEAEGFGHCSFSGTCEVECPEAISITHIAKMNARLAKAKRLE